MLIYRLIVYDLYLLMSVWYCLCDFYTVKGATRIGVIMTQCLKRAYTLKFEANIHMLELEYFFSEMK